MTRQNPKPRVCLIQALQIAFLPCRPWSAPKLTLSKWPQIVLPNGLTPAPSRGRRPRPLECVKNPATSSPSTSLLSPNQCLCLDRHQIAATPEAKPQPPPQSTHTRPLRSPSPSPPRRDRGVSR